MNAATLWTAGVCLFVTSTAGAQTVRDGIVAFTQGDYQRAAEILKPFAENTNADRVAAFFLATMYDSGLGIPVDRMRACALYMRAGDVPTPLGSEAVSRLRTFSTTMMNRDDFEHCSKLAYVGLNSGFEPATFTLEPGHSVAVDLRGATVSYGNKEKRTEFGVAIPGAVYLPIQHRELDTGGASVSRRHFIEILAWTPAPDGRTWKLLWQLFEVVADDLVHVAGEQIATASGVEPPTAFDVRSTVRLVVNDRGQVEWETQGPPRRGGVIETAAEREEARRRERARSDALARVDWTRVVDLRRTPRIRYSDGDGCGEVFVYGWSDDRTEAITVTAGKERLQLQTAAQTFDIARQPAGLEVQLHVYERAVRRWPFCTDVIVEPRAPETVWRAVAGTVTIELSPRGVDARMPFGYRATIRIVGAEFVDGTGTRVRQIEPITLTALVGSFAG